MYLTIQAAAAAIKQGQATPNDLLEQCLRQIDKYEEKVKAWVFVATDEAKEQAERLTAELKAGQNRGPLHGIPIGIKDIIDVANWPTAAGSKLWANSIAREDATLVKKLRHAGAIILGKTVTTQYASFDPPPTRNPWNLERTPGGSSSGSAAAVACGMCLGAIGTQTGGSITRPAAYCGVASCKPEFGRVSIKGIVPLAPSMDHPGPMARSVWDLAVILEAIAGPDPGDAATMRNFHRDGFMFDLQASVPPRLSRPKGMFEELATPPVRSMMAEVERQLNNNGAEFHEVVLPSEFSEVLTRHRIVMAVEAATFHEERFKRHPDDYKPNFTKLLRDGLACPAPEYARCKTHQHSMQGPSALPWFVVIDALLVPATTSTAPDKATTGDPAFNSPWSYTGLPAVSIPAGWSVDGLPLSIQLIGPPLRVERRLLEVAAWCEKVLAQQIKFPPTSRAGVICSLSVLDL